MNNTLKPVRVDLTAREFKNFSPTPHDCPIARALKKYFDTDNVVIEDRFIAYINERAYYFPEYTVPDEQADYILARLVFFLPIKLHTIELYDSITQLPGYYKSVLSI